MLKAGNALWFVRACRGAKGWAAADRDAESGAVQLSRGRRNRGSVSTATRPVTAILRVRLFLRELRELDMRCG